jgi:Carboxypeptidase regulatory-like domain
VFPARITFRFRHLLGLIHFATFILLAGLAAVSAMAQVNGSLGTGLSSATDSGAPSTVSGQVINAVTGLPVARAIVRWNDRAVLTDHDGKFEFGQNTLTGGNIMAIKPGFSFSADSSTQNIFLQSNQLAAPLRLLLYPEAVLTGTVLAPDGTPLSGTQVSAYDEVGHRLANAGQTDSHGDFRIPVPAGSYRIETQYVPKDRTTGLAVLPVVIPDGSSSDTSNEIRIHSGEEQHFDLRPAFRNTHRVTANVDRGMGFARFTARTSNGGTFQISPTSNGTGEMTMELPQGTYTLMGRRNNPESPEEAETTVTVPDHDVSGVVLHFSPIPSIPVELLIDESSTSDNSQPSLTQFDLVLVNDHPNVEQDGATIRVNNVANRFSFNASPGSYHLVGRGSGGWYIKSVSNGTSDVFQQGLVVAPGTGGTPLRVTISNQTGSLQGTVKLNGVPSNCWVYLIPTTPGAALFFLIRSNAEGAYSTAQLPPGSYQAIAFESRHSVNYRDPSVLEPFAARVSSITVNAGDKATLDLDAVPNSELVP